MALRQLSKFSVLPHLTFTVTRKLSAGVPYLICSGEACSELVLERPTCSRDRCARAQRSAVRAAVYDCFSLSAPGPARGLPGQLCSRPVVPRAGAGWVARPA